MNFLLSMSGTDLEFMFPQNTNSTKIVQNTKQRQSIINIWTFQDYLSSPHFSSQRARIVLITKSELSYANNKTRSRHSVYKRIFHVFTQDQLKITIFTTV
jgi:hypothetical protein